jgi:hypothetical protein
VALKTCRVSCVDLCGIKHAVEVSTSSLYKAVAQALRIFREHDWCQDSSHSAATVAVAIKQPEVEHRVRIRDLENWLNSAARSPAEMTLKSRLRDTMGRVTDLR